MAHDNHVQTQREIIAEEIEPILEAGLLDTDMHTIPAGLLKELATYVLTKIHENYQKNVSMGIDIGRREAKAMLDSPIPKSKSMELEMQTCQECQGTGKLVYSNTGIENGCYHCGGFGRVPVPK